MIKRCLGLIAVLVALSACDVPSTSPAAMPQDYPRATLPETTVRTFLQVVETVEPVAERECRGRTSGMNCNFIILVDDRAGLPPNAFQTLDDRGRPLVIFTVALIKDARNADELAFVLGHEAAHHIEGHIPRQRQNAVAGAVVFGGIAAMGGADASGVERAQQIGAQVGARQYSKEFELEADALGTIIAARAGYDPVRGAAYFNRIPDPGDRFLGTHPPNAARIEVVRRTAAGL